MMTDLRPFLLGLRNRHFLALDLVACAVAPTTALLMLVNSPDALEQYAPSLFVYTWLSLGAKLLVFWAVGLYNRYWPYASVDGLEALARSAVMVLVVELGLFFALLLPSNFVAVNLPRSLPLFSALITILLIGSSRLAVRWLFERSERKKGSRVMKPVLVAGAGVAGAMVVKELRMNPQVGLTPVAFLDDDPRKQKARIHGIPVVGTLAQVSEAVREYRTHQVIIAMPAAPAKVVRDLVAACKKAGVQARTVPGVYEIVSGAAKVSEFRDIQIESLLQRGVANNDPREVTRLVQGKRVMVTGAGGTIGSELCRQISAANPAQLILLGHGENSIFKISQELQRRLASPVAAAVIGDIRDKKRMDQVFRTYRPEIIFHAAAHKHVGLMQVNVADAVTNNVLGTRNLVELSARYAVERFVMISSDKAVNPTSVMGATKRIAEFIVHDAAVTTGKPFVSVRFGNVLGSWGSVVPIFKEQIASGGPVTVSTPDVTRYFMTIPEAAKLVLQAGALGEGGELFVLDMGEPMRILDLAKDVVRMSGLEEGRDIDIVFTGLQPGEKLHEEPFLPGEHPVRSRHEKILVCPQAMDGNDLLRQSVDELVEEVQFNRVHRLHELIQRIVPEYRPVHRSVAQSTSAIPELERKDTVPKKERGVMDPASFKNDGRNRAR